MHDRTFDAAADGYGRGEGIAVAFLAPSSMPSSAAPLALIVGSATNQDGRSSSLTAPNGPSQSRLVANALATGGLDAARLSFVAVHGTGFAGFTSIARECMLQRSNTGAPRTGTPLGDPIEVGAIGQALSHQHAPAIVSLGSVKSCFGHTEGAAGVTGVLLAAAYSRCIARAANMHLVNANPYVTAALEDWSKAHGLASGIARQLAPGVMRSDTVAGTSSFGMSGVNAHVLVAQHTGRLLLVF